MNYEKLAECGLLLGDVSNVNVLLRTVLLYRKGNKWYYALTSPHDETGEIVTSIQWATRQSIVGGIEKGIVNYFPAKKGKR